MQTFEIEATIALFAFMSLPSCLHSLYHNLHWTLLTNITLIKMKEGKILKTATVVNFVAMIIGTVLFMVWVGSTRSIPTEFYHWVIFPIIPAFIVNGSLTLIFGLLENKYRPVSRDPPEEIKMEN